MTTQDAFSKRIRRHVTGRIRDFFAATAPGFESLCLKELLSLPLSAKDAKIIPGGVAFKGRLYDCYLANLKLRTANRILMRLAEFKASNFSRLEKKLADFPWELFLSSVSNPEALPRISVNSRHSRLYHKDAISERFKASISERFKKCGTDISGMSGDMSEQQLFVRAADDRFTVSLDSSGELLYKRGIKTYTGDAPLRETTAAAILKLAGYTGKEPLLDPLCGSGTFSIEGAMAATHTPSGWKREFAFMKWPSFMPQRWDYIRQGCEKQITPVTAPLIFASDKDETACSLFKKHMTEAGYPLGSAVEVFCADFFDLSPKKLTGGRAGLVVLNPPYGHRMGTKHESGKLFRAISGNLKKNYSGWKFALIVPEKYLLKYLPFRFRAHRFFHGGLELTLTTGKI